MFRKMKQTRLTVLIALSCLLLGGSVLAGQTNLEQAVAETNPDGYGAVEGPIELISDGRGTAWLEAVSEVETDTARIAPGEVVYAGEKVHSGILINNSGEPITLLAGGGSEFLLFENEMLEVAAASGCSVSCQTGYYACCKRSGIFVARCWCVKNGTAKPSSCDNGGPGSSGCSTSSAS